MIFIDFVLEETNKPVLVEIVNLRIEEIAQADPEKLNNEELTTEQRNEVAKTVHCLMGDTKNGGHIVLDGLDSEEAAQEVYDNIVEAVKRGDRVYSLRGKEDATDGKE